MSENDPTNIAIALSILLEEIEREREVIGDVGARAFEEHNYDKVDAVRAYASQFSAFREKVVALSGEWETLEGARTRRTNLEEDSQEERGTEGEVSPLLLLAWDDGEESHSPQANTEEETIPVKYSFTSTRRGGLHASRKAYIRPILEALSEFGGSAKLSDLLEKLAQTMKDILKEADYWLTSTGEVSWRYAVRRVHQDMLKQGLLKWGSQKGLWEISETGRSALTEGRI